MISLLMITIYPIFIAPLFNKFTPLEEGPLRDAVYAYVQSEEKVEKKRKSMGKEGKLRAK